MASVQRRNTSTRTRRHPARTRKRLLELEFHTVVLDTMLAAGTQGEDQITEGEATCSKSNEQPISPFCCPITNKRLRDPVVAPNGATYERCMAELSGKTLYPNRILKSILEESTDPPLNATMKLLESALTNTNNDDRESQIAEAVEKLLLELNDLPEAYHCPITFRPMRDPVIDPEGNTYDRVAIVGWLEEKGTSPITRNPINVQDLYPNHIMSLSHTFQQLRSSLKQWKKMSKAREVEFLNEIVSICAAGEDNDAPTIRENGENVAHRPDPPSTRPLHHEDSPWSSSSSSSPPSPSGESGGRRRLSFPTDFPSNGNSIPSQMESWSYRHSATSRSSASSSSAYYTSSSSSQSSSSSSDDDLSVTFDADFNHFPNSSEQRTLPSSSATLESSGGWTWSSLPPSYQGIDSGAEHESSSITSSSSLSTTERETLLPNRTTQEARSNRRQESSWTRNTILLLCGKSLKGVKHKKWSKRLKKITRRTILGRKIRKFPNNVVRFVRPHVSPIVTGIALVIMLAIRGAAFVVGTPIVLIVALGFWGWLFLTG